MARRILNRKDLRADYEAAERRKQEDEPEGDEDELDDEDEDETEASEDEADEEEEGDEDEPVKKKKPKVVKEVKPKRTRTPKQVRQKVVWGVFSNSNQRVATFPYAQRKEADEHAARLKADKNQTYFVQPVKENIDEKKE
jgi:hypothetical protein